MSAIYNDYLSGEEWKSTRWWYLRGHRVCEACHELGMHTATKLNVHHLTYNDEKGCVLGREQSMHMMTLCESCHKLVHEYLDALFNRGDIKELLNEWGYGGEEFVFVAQDIMAIETERVLPTYKTYREFKDYPRIPSFIWKATEGWCDNIKYKKRYGKAQEHN